MHITDYGILHSAMILDLFDLGFYFERVADSPRYHIDVSLSLSLNLSLSFYTFQLHTRHLSDRHAQGGSVQHALRMRAT